MNVLIACEESQEVCKAFRERGHNAYSCDVQECSGGHAEWHIRGDALDVMNGCCTFTTQAGGAHRIDTEWDLLIAHPPCTYLSNAGACRLYPQAGVLDEERLKMGIRAKDFFMAFWYARCKRIAIENPTPSTVFCLPPPSQIIQPFMFGHAYSKETCLWLKGLPILMATDIVADFVPYVSCGTSRNKGNKEKAGASRAGGAAKVRSKTFPGVAAAMAEQWGGDAR